MTTNAERLHPIPHVKTARVRSACEPISDEADERIALMHFEQRIRPPRHRHHRAVAAGAGRKLAGDSFRVIVSSHHGAHDIVISVLGRCEQRLTAVPHCTTRSARSNGTAGRRAATSNGRRVAERQVRDDAERLGRQAEVAHVASDDAHMTIGAEPSLQPGDEHGIDLDRGDTSGALGELGREHAGARTDLDDEIAARDAGVPDEVSREARDEEVLTGPGA